MYKVKVLILFLLCLNIQVVAETGGDRLDKNHCYDGWFRCNTLEENIKETALSVDKNKINDSDSVNEPNFQQQTKILVEKKEKLLNTVKKLNESLDLINLQKQWANDNVKNMNKNLNSAKNALKTISLADSITKEDCKKMIESDFNAMELSLPELIK